MAPKSYTERLIEMLVNLSDEQKEIVAVHLLGIVMGMRMADDLRREEKSA